MMPSLLEVHRNRQHASSITPADQHCAINAAYTRSFTACRTVANLPPCESVHDLVAGNGVLVVISSSESFAYSPDANGIIARFPSPAYNLVSGFYNPIRREMVLCNLIKASSEPTLGCVVYDGTRHTQRDVNLGLPPLRITPATQRLCFLDLIGVMLAASDKDEGEELVAYSLHTYTRLYSFSLPQRRCQVQACPSVLCVLCGDKVHVRHAATGQPITELRVVLDPARGALHTALLLNTSLVVQQQQGPLELMPLMPRGGQQPRITLSDSPLDPDCIVLCPQFACFALLLATRLCMYNEQGVKQWEINLPPVACVRACYVDPVRGLFVVASRATAWPWMYDMAVASLHTGEDVAWRSFCTTSGAPGAHVLLLEGDVETGLVYTWVREGVLMAWGAGAAVLCGEQAPL